MDKDLRNAARAGKWTLALWMLVVGISSNVLARAQSQELASGNSQSDTPAPAQASQPQLGTIRGTVVDQSGAVMANVKITLTQQSLPSAREALSDADGDFVFTDIAAGPFQLSFTAKGFDTQAISGVLHAGENDTIPQIALVVARANVDVEVTESTAQIAEDEVKVEEKQRILGVIPNFYVSYVPHAAPLTTKLKYQLAWKSIIDPVSFGITGGIAGIEQANNSFSGYGQGWEGYGKRYGAGLADSSIGGMLGGAVLPTLFHQDPRYFYKGTGSTQSRIWYAISRSVIARGDNGKWQPAYAGILGDFGSGAISNLYYPASNRNGAGLTIANGLLDVASDGLGNLLQEFVVRRFTPHLSAQDAAKP